MKVLSIMMLVISGNLDSLMVGISYGVKRIRVSLISNMIIAGIIFISTFITMLLASHFEKYLPVSLANTIGGVLLVILGMLGVIKYIKNMYDKSECDWSESEKYDKDQNKIIDSKEAVLLGFILSLNNIGLAIGAAISGFPILATSVISAGMSLFLFPLGTLMGNSIFAGLLEHYADLISGILIVALGLFEIFI